MAIGFPPGGGEIMTGAYDYLKHNGSAHSTINVTAVTLWQEIRTRLSRKHLSRLHSAVKTRSEWRLFVLYQSGTIQMSWKTSNLQCIPITH